jgi:N-terminal domain on NACHT_NTPase and P-loop NTPases
MAEALAAVGAVANIVQLVDFGSKVLLRLNDFLSNSGRVPKTFQHLQTELRVLLDALKHTKTAIETGSVPDQTREALRPAIDGCRIQIETLDAVLAKTLPILGDSWRKRGIKAISSLYQDGKVKEIRAELYRSIQALTYYHTATSSVLCPTTGTADKLDA